MPPRGKRACLVCAGSGVRPSHEVGPVVSEMGTVFCGCPAGGELLAQRLAVALGARAAARRRELTRAELAAWATVRPHDHRRWCDDVRVDALKRAVAALLAGGAPDA